MSNPARAGSAGVIQTERLDLLPLGVPFLEAFLEGDAAGAARRLGHPLPPEWQPQAWVSRRLAQLHADPTLEPWLLRAVILRTTGRMIGRAGFHTAPGPDYLLVVVVAALMAWAAQEHGVRRFVLSIRPDNLPSQRIAQHFDFHKIGSHIDEEDGLEEIFLLDLDCEV